MLSVTFRLSFLTASLVIVVFVSLAQDRSKEEKVLQDSINGGSVEMTAGSSVDRYMYDGVSLQGCAFKWTEQHETYESGKRIIKELIESTVSLDLIDEKQVNAGSLKNGGYLVSLQTRDRKNQILTREQTQWGDDPESQTTGITSGRGLYFGTHQTAETVSRTIAGLVRACRNNTANKTQ